MTILLFTPTLQLDTFVFPAKVCHILCFLYDVFCHPINTGTSFTCLLAFSSECIKQLCVLWFIDGPNIGDEEQRKARIMPGGEADQGQEAAHAIRVVAETRNLRTQPFVVPDETNCVGKAWEEWLEGIEREFRYYRITEAVQKRPTRKTPSLSTEGKR